MYCDSQHGGLGFIPGVVAVVGTAHQAGAFDLAGDIFGGPDWEEAALAGQIECPGPFDPRQVEAALNVAPRGTPGLVGPGGPTDPTLGTVEGARVALEVHPDFKSEFRPANNRELANALVYVAHGAEDCDPSDWKDEPAVVHVQALLARAGSIAPAPAPAPGGGGVWEPPIPIGTTPAPTWGSGFVPGGTLPPPVTAAGPTGGTMALLAAGGLLAAMMLSRRA